MGSIYATFNAPLPFHRIAAARHADNREQHGHGFPGEAAAAPVYAHRTSRMEVVSIGPLCAASLIWRHARGSWAQTVICKATFNLAPDESPLAGDQEPLNENDNHWDDDPARSLYAPSDLVPRKPRADVLLVGKAFAPRGEQVRSLVARLVVGAVDKSIEVHCDRAWTADGKLLEGPPFSSMSLFYERSGGGPETWNPVGLGSGARPDVHGAQRVANLQPRGFQLKDRSTPIPPVGFGPVAAHWPERARRLGRHAALAGKDWRHQPLPDDLDAAWFNAAPSDQQLDAFHEGERILLENLHRDHARLSTTLAGVRPRAYVEAGGAQRPIRMACDTLWIDTDRAICTLTWRGVVPLQRPDEPGRIVLASEDRGRPLDGADLKHRIRDRAKDRAEPSKLPDHHMDTLTIRPSQKSAQQVRDAVLPFLRRPEASPPAAPPPPPPAPPPPPPPALVSPPSLRPEPPPPSFSLSEPPALAKAAPAPPPPPPVSAAPPLAPEPPPPAPPSARRGPKIGAWVPPGSAPEPVVSSAPSGSALEASNAAAGVNSRAPAQAPAPSRPAAPWAGGDVIELLWFDPGEVARIRKHPAWKKVIADARPRGRDEEFSDADPREKQKEAKDRRDILAVLRSGEPSGAAGLGEELAAAMEDGTFTPPLALVEGVLEFPFDEKETLKATMALVAPFTAGDKRLKEQSDTVSELLKSPWLERGSAGLEGYTTRLREAFAQPARGLPPRYLEAHTERLLLEQRHYQKRTLLGQEWIRALLTPAAAGGALAEAIPTYLPERLAKELPMFLRFRARAIMEARLQLDQFEAHPSALRVVALGRVVPTPLRR